MRARRVVCQAVAGVLTLAPLAWLIMTAVDLAPQLGPRMASHWSGDPTPDGFADTVTSFWMFAAIVAALTIAAVALVIASSTSAPARMWAGITTGLSGLSALAWAVPALSTAAASTPEEAALGARMLLLVPVAALGILVVVVLRPAESGSPDPNDEDTVSHAIALGAGDRLAWSGTTGSGWFLAPAVALIAGALCCAIVSVSTGTPGLVAAATFLFLVGCSLLLIARVRLRIDARGVRLISEVFRIPLISTRLDDIESVSAERIDPLRWGGWGYRISGRGIAYVTRRSEGIVITRHRGVTVAVTIADAEQAAAAVRLLVDQRAAATRREA